MLKSYGNVIWLDLPGHGKSQPISRYTMHDLSSLIVNICKAQDLKNICLVGLNNGANIAIDAVVKQGLNIQKLILIDPPIF